MSETFTVFEHAATILATKSDAIGLALCVGVIGLVLYLLGDWTPRETTAEGRKRVFEVKGPR